MEDLLSEDEDLDLVLFRNSSATSKGSLSGLVSSNLPTLTIIKFLKRFRKIIVGKTVFLRHLIQSLKGNDGETHRILDESIILIIENYSMVFVLFLKRTSETFKADKEILYYFTKLEET